MKYSRPWIVVPLLFVSPLLMSAPLVAQDVLPPPGLVLPGPDAPPEEPVEPMAEPAIVPDGSVHVELQDGSSLMGKLDVTQEIGLTMSVGKAKIPARKVISLEFDDKGNVRVRSISGDIYSGKLDDDSMQIEVAWGKVEIPTKHISMVVSQAHVAQMQTQLIPIVQTSPDGRVTTTFAEQMIGGASYNGYIPQPSTPYGAYGGPRPPSAMFQPPVPAEVAPAIRVHGGTFE